MQCAAVALGVTALVVLPGCVRRRLMVRSNPPGATVYVDNQPVGTTPCATSFTYYGTREIRLVKAGYETLTIKQPIPAPWYQIPPLDFASENLVPGTIQDFRTVTYTMTPQVIVPPQHLIARAEQLRSATQQGAAIPAGSVGPLGAAAPMAPSMTSPGVGLPSAPPTWSPEPVTPGILVPTAPSGGGALPPYGVPLEPLPAPQ